MGDELSVDQPRPTADDVERALELVEMAGAFAVSAAGDVAQYRGAVAVLRRAVTPRPVWPTLEVCAALGVESSNLKKVRGLPEPAQRLPRPTALHPDREVRLWYVDEIEAFAAKWRAKREGVGA